MAKIMYLVKEVGQGKVLQVVAKVQTITLLPVPTTHRQYGWVLSWVLPEFFVSGGSPDLRSKECQYAFDCMKTLLYDAPVLLAPDFKLEVDASVVGAGAVLLQADSLGLYRPVCYCSKFEKHQLAYSKIEKETLALLLMLQHFEVYLCSSASPIMVHHNLLVFLSPMYSHNQRLMRWALIM